VAAGMLVGEGKFTWDKPVRDSVPAIQFYTDQLNNTVTLRDMLAHRTGITRHDTIWYKSDFTRKPETPDPVFLKKCAGTYETPTGSKFQVVFKVDGHLYLNFLGQPEDKLIPYKGAKFRVQQFSDVLYEFVVENGEVKALKERNPSGEYVYTRK
jgi:hypothetical protein